MTTPSLAEVIALSDPLSVVAVVTVNGGEALVLNRPLRFRYERVGDDYIGKDGPYTDVLGYSHGSGRFVAFAGRTITVRMVDGTTESLKDHWWQTYIPGSVSAPHADVESLKQCYVFSGGACISLEDYNALRSAYTGPVYGYWDYEKVIKFDDMRKDFYRRLTHEQSRVKALIKEVKEKDAAIARASAASLRDEDASKAPTVAYACKYSTGIHFVSDDRDDCLEESRRDGSLIVELIERPRSTHPTQPAAQERQ